MKRFLGFIVSIAICSTICLPILAQEPYSVSLSLAPNTTLLNQSFNKNAERQTIMASSENIQITLNKEKNVLHISNPISATLSGEINEVSADKMYGYVGVFYGIDNDIPIIADVVYNNDNEMFVVLTSGALGTDDFKVTFYGDYTDSLKALSNKYSNLVMEEQQENTGMENSDLLYTSSVDGQIKFQNSGEIYPSGNDQYTFGHLDVYHPDELRNQGNMRVYARVNTNCQDVEDYLLDTEGYFNSLYVYPEKFNISICGNNDNIYALNNSFNPQPAETTVQLTIPYPLPSGAVEFFSIELPTSKTKVTTGKFSSDSPYDTNKVNWEISKVMGWSPSKTDGDKESKTGMVGSSDYTISANITSNRNYSMTSRCTIGYAYQYVVGESIMTLHLTTNELPVTSTITVVP